MAARLTVDEISGFQKWVTWLDDNYGAILDRSDDEDFNYRLGAAVQQIKAISESLGCAEVTI